MGGSSTTGLRRASRPTGRTAPDGTPRGSPSEQGQQHDGGLLREERVRGTRVPSRSRHPGPASTSSPSTVNRSRPDSTWTIAARDAVCSVRPSPASKPNTVTSRSSSRWTTFDTTAPGWLGDDARHVGDRADGSWVLLSVSETRWPCRRVRPAPASCARANAGAPPPPHPRVVHHASVVPRHGPPRRVHRALTSEPSAASTTSSIEIRRAPGEAISAAAAGLRDGDPGAREPAEDLRCERPRQRHLVGHVGDRHVFPAS